MATGYDTRAPNNDTVEKNPYFCDHKYLYHAYYIPL